VSLLLVDTDVIDLAACRKIGPRRVAAVIASDGQVQQEVVALLERVSAFRVVVDRVFQVCLI